ncbi:hypothetical protein AWC38_SpisGene2136 [Stylophora pistillata]|uniref:Uncharacterized protein n=1 Tax=Stylophora pistillata TaxID=50429 RepID=A0A2B4SXC3_STYPI|nr:hypothetical protein AWC38_SpisGene2136 [Stylophora pistillata]
MSLTGKSLKELWAKEFLLNIREEIRKEVDLLKAGLQDLRKRFEEIEKSQDFISKKYDTVISTIKDVKEHNDSLKGDIRGIKEDIGKLGNDYLNVEIQLDELEQYAQRYCLEITGADAATVEFLYSSNQVKQVHPSEKNSPPLETNEQSTEDTKVLESKECPCLITLSNLSPKYLKYYVTSHPQNNEQKTKLGALPDETSDTGFGENSENFAQSKDAIVPDQAEGLKIYEKSEPSETRSSDYDKKGYRVPLRGVQSAALNKVLTLDKVETLSVGSKSSCKSRHSIRSCTSGSSRPSKETLINVKAKRAALEQKLKFSDKIEEQQKILNKLRLQQQLSETLAEEAVYEEALKEQNPSNFDDIDQLPKETIIDRFVNQAEFVPTHPTSTGSLLSPLNKNEGLPVNPFADTGHLPHIRPSATMAPTDTGLLAPPNLATDYPTTSQLLTFSANTGGLITSQSFVLSTSNSLAAPKTAVNASTPFTPLPQVPPTPHPRDFPPVTTSLRAVHPSASDLRLCADPFTPASSPATMYREIKPTPHVQGENRTPANSDSVFQIAEALAKVTQLQWLPQAKPDVFTGNETDTKFFVWETAFDALIDSAPISAQKKLYLLYQHLDGKAKKVVEQLQYMVAASPEIAYSEARKKLKSRFGRPAIIATDFENKLVNWPKIGSNDA